MPSIVYIFRFAANFLFTIGGGISGATAFGVSLHRVDTLIRLLTALKLVEIVQTVFSLQEVAVLATQTTVATRLKGLVDVCHRCALFDKFLVSHALLTIFILFAFIRNLDLLIKRQRIPMLLYLLLLHY